MKYELKFRIKKTKTVSMCRAEKRLAIGTLPHCHKQLWNVSTGKKFKGKTVHITPEGEYMTKNGNKLAINVNKCANNIANCA